jgi:calcineurin-like phosphoesterase family protein
MPEAFFTSDPHFDHENIIKYCNRPFSSVEEMNEGIIEANNKIVKPNDELYILGDIVFGINPRRLAEILSRLNGNKIIILGNHDTTQYFTRDIYKYEFKHKIRSYHYRILELHGKQWGGYSPTLCHYPMLSWNASFHGSFQLHGHTHGNIPFDPAVKRLDVGVDSNSFKPWNWEEIVVKLKDIPTPKEQFEAKKKAKIELENLSNMVKASTKD